MAAESLVRLLRDHPFLRGMKEGHLEFMTGCASNVRFDAGDFLARDGQAAATTYLLRKGRVALEVHVPGKGTQRVQTAEAGEVLGWAWLFAPYEWHFDARALEPCLCLAFDGKCLREKLEGDHDLGYDFLKRVVLAAHQRLERSRLQHLDIYSGPDQGANPE